MINLFWMTKGPTVMSYLSDQSYADYFQRRGATLLRFRRIQLANQNNGM